MPTDISNLRSTIVPKSDQMNFEDLLTGPKTITITDVRPGSDEQPLVIHFEGDAGHPYKPNKTYRKVLIFAWGDDGRQWIGRSMTLFGDPTVKWAGVEVGGIGISHLSHIERPINISLTATRGKKVKHTIQVLEVAESIKLEDVLSAIHNASNKATMEYAKNMAMGLTNEDDVKVAQDAYKNRVSELKNKGAQSE